MEKGIFSFVLRYSKPQQLYLLAVVAISFPFLYMSYDLPKIIINGAISEDAKTPFQYFGFGPELTRIEYLMALCGTFLMLVLINGQFKFYVNVFRGSLGERMLRRIRYQLLQRVLRFPLPHFRSISQGEIVSIVTTETEPLGAFFSESISLPAFQGGTLLTLLAFMFAQDWALGVAAIALYPVQMYFIPKLQTRVNQLAKERVQTVRKLSERVSELVSGVNGVHANDTGQFELADFSGRLGKIYKIRVEIYKKKFFIKFINNFLAMVTPFLFYAIGGYFVIQQQLTFGALVAALAAYKDLSSPWKELLTYYQRMEDSKIKYTQLVDRFEPPGLMDQNLLDAREHVDTKLEGKVTAANMSLVDDEGTKLVSAVNFSFDSSDHVAFIGPPSSGKDDIARLLARQLTPSGGNLTIGDTDLAGLHEAVTGRQISYVDSEVYISAGTIKDNLFYVLKNHPRAANENLDKKNRDDHSQESEMAGNTTFHVDDDWIDYQSLGVDGPAGLTEKAVSVLIAVGLEGDIFDLGMRKVIDPKDYPEIVEGMMKVRSAVHENLDKPAISGLVQVFDKERYNTNASVAENILFGSPVDDTFDIENLGHNEFVLGVLEQVGLRQTFIEMGLTIATQMVDLFQDLPPGHEFFERFSFIEADALPEFQSIINVATNKGMDNLTEGNREKLTDLPFKMVVSRHRLDLITDDIQTKLLAARKLFAESLPDDLRDRIEFFEIDAYSATGTILDNALFGKVESNKANSRAQVVEFVTSIIDELGLRTSVLEMGMEYDVGIGGKRLSLGQRQKLGMARALLKDGEMMVVNDAAAALTKAEQRSILAGISKARAGKGLIWITDDAEVEAEFPIVFEVESGRVQARSADGGEPQPAQPAEPDAGEDEGAATALGQDMELMSGIQFFAGLDRSQLKLLAFTSSRQTLEPGEILFRQGDEGDMAYVIVDGDFDILVDTQEGQTKVASQTTGAVIGELALLADAPRTATVQAVGDGTLLRITKDVFLQLVMDNAEMGANLSRIIASRLEKMMRGFVDNRQPLYDKVTGFANRSLFLDRITQAVTTNSRDGKMSSLVVMNFKELPDLAADWDDEITQHLLKEIAERLQNQLRKSDSLSHLDGFSFGLIAKDGEPENSSELLTARIREAFVDPFEAGDGHIELKDKIDINVYLLDEKNADTAADIV